MSVFDATTPQEANLLVAFYDLKRFFIFSQTRSAQEIFDALSGYFEFSGDLIQASGGKVIKFLGDAGLVAYPEDRVDQGVQAMLDLKQQGDAWLTDHNIPCQNTIGIHFGPVVCGPLGTRGDKRFDIIGHTVNIAAKLNSNGVAITPQVFRQLGPETRKRFKKHTPPVTYIPTNQRHHD